MNNRTPATESILIAVAIVSFLVVIAMLVLIAQGSGNWFTVAGSGLTTIAAVSAVVRSRRARKRAADAALDQSDEPRDI
jgi:CHASE2 domain-containing sensor protein